MPLVSSISMRLGPLVLVTFLKHFLERKAVTQVSKARDEIFFDQVWNLASSHFHDLRSIDDLHIAGFCHS